MLRRIPPPLSTIANEYGELPLNDSVERINSIEPFTLQKSALFGVQWAVRFQSVANSAFSVDSFTVTNAV